MLIRRKAHDRRKAGEQASILFNEQQSKDVMIAWLNGVDAGVWKTLWITVSAIAHLLIVMGVMWGGAHWASKDAAMVPGALAVFTVGGAGILLKWMDYWYLKHVAPPLGAILCHAIMILFAVAYITVRAMCMCGVGAASCGCLVLQHLPSCFAS